MYEMRFSEEFRRRAKDAMKKRTAKFKEAIEEIVADPYNARRSHVLTHEWGGFRAADFEGAERFVYRICEECVQKNQQSLHPLPCCEDEARNLLWITFVNFGDYHKSAGKRRLEALAEYPLADIPEALKIASGTDEEQIG